MAPDSIEILGPRSVPLGGPRAMPVARTLPQRHRSTIGAWCFIDHYGPDDVSATGGMDVAPHPHTGLQTVSWLFSGKIMHHDSADNHAVVRPGEVNLMTAGSGICHSEVSTQDTTVLHGVQLWTVLPDAHRHTTRRFDHYAPPTVLHGPGRVQVFLGTLLGSAAPPSPLPTYTPLLGAQVDLPAGTQIELQLDTNFEHGILVDTGTIHLILPGNNAQQVSPQELAFLANGPSRVILHNPGQETARMLLLGGEPFEEEFVMWWNFIGRTHDEVTSYREEWQQHGQRFGHVEGYISHDPSGLSRLPAPTLPPVQLRPRGGRKQS
ncbi:pirin family protein [Corynebacterium lizhenjunii]|uniref:Pirin family protein n=1 Tax=Corynebacterium lizhenjunii TaxID=2709394 RepID=A0A7T0KGY2_9CORY|nr:pirin family protein [Corynebacterium lizhenjunii]QPK79959.1 pirin family protein [Corynebacterium lizhenjunii]